MPHTASRYQQDLGFTDGEIFLGVGDIYPNNVANGVVTRNAAGDWSINQAASLTVIYGVNVTNALLRRSGFFEDLQEQFGGAGIAASAAPQGRPDTFAGSGTVEALGQQLIPRSAFKLKGFKLVEFDVVYMITVAALTSISLRADLSNFVNNVALAPQAVLAAGANGLVTTFQANPQVTTVVLPAAQQIYRIANDSQLWLDLTVVTPVNSLFRLYGFDCDFEFNYN